MHPCRGDLPGGAHGSLLPAGELAPGLQEDRGDPDSQHLYFVKEGLSSRPVDPRKVPRFVDRFDFAAGLQAATWDLMTLILLGVVTYLAAYLSFLRCDLAES